MWQRGNTYSLLVEIQTGVNTIEISAEVPGKAKNRTDV